jgi:hypothetical protein
LKQHDPDEISLLLKNGGLSDLPRAEFAHEDWRIKFYPLPKSLGARGDTSIRPLGMMGPSEAHWVDNRTALRNAVIKKAGRYGKLGAPYFIAVNTVSQHVDQIDVMEALFGKETYKIPVLSNGRSGEPVMERLPDGALRGPAGPTNKRVSGVLVVKSLIPWSVGAYSPTVYHNPWAAWPCLEALRDLPSALPAEGTLPISPGKTFAELVGLRDGWPMQNEEDASDQD